MFYEFLEKNQIIYLPSMLVNKVWKAAHFINRHKYPLDDDDEEYKKKYILDKMRKFLVISYDVHMLHTHNLYIRQIENLYIDIWPVKENKYLPIHQQISLDKKPYT